jgi:hypothetical protein
MGGIGDPRAATRGGPRRRSTGVTSVAQGNRSAASVRAPIANDAAPHHFVFAIVLPKFSSSPGNLVGCRVRSHDRKRFHPEFSVEAADFRLGAPCGRYCDYTIRRRTFIEANSRSECVQYAHFFISSEVRVVACLQRRTNIAANPLCSWVLVLMIGSIRQ